MFLFAFVHGLHPGADAALSGGALPRFRSGCGGDFFPAFACGQRGKPVLEFRFHDGQLFFSRRPPFPAFLRDTQGFLYGADELFMHLAQRFNIHHGTLHLAGRIDGGLFEQFRVAAQHVVGRVAAAFF